MMNVRFWAMSIGVPFWESAGVRYKIDLRIGAPSISQTISSEPIASQFDLTFIDADKQSCGSEGLATQETHGLPTMQELERWIDERLWIVLGVHSIILRGAGDCLIP